MKLQPVVLFMATNLCSDAGGLLCDHAHGGGGGGGGGGWRLLARQPPELSSIFRIELLGN